MTLIKSISGIRGTIGGSVGDNFTPVDIVKFTTSYAIWIKRQNEKDTRLKVVLGRDARLSGAMVEGLVINTLISCGIDVLNLGLSTTPTVEMATVQNRAHGGIILTASHNPKQWNALKLLNHLGEFLSGENGKEILEISQQEDLFDYSLVDDLGVEKKITDSIDRHIDEILALPLINTENIRAMKFKVVVDAVNSTGGIAIPMLLEKMGVEMIPLYCEPTGHFPHNPEPLEEHLMEICKQVPAHSAHLGFVVDPDVDRLAIISEKGKMFGEEYTLVACADYVLSKKPGATVSNLSSSRALEELTSFYNQSYFAAPVGEVNVVKLMKEKNAIVGGEGNGGIILPELHYGRDALVGIVLFLALLAEKRCTVSALRDRYPSYFMSKRKMELASIDAMSVLDKVKEAYQNERISTIDGVKIDFEDSWVHLRTSNTEPIIRIYTEAKTQEQADRLADRFIKEMQSQSLDL